MFDEDLTPFFNVNELADTVEYTPSGGTAKDIIAVLERTGDYQEPYADGQGASFATAEITVKRDDVSSAQHGDLYTFDGDIWEHDPARGIIYKDENIIQIALRRQET